MAVGVAIGQIGEFRPADESFRSYSERLVLFMDANGIEEERRVAVLLTVIGPRNYALLHDLLAPATPTSKSVADLLKTLEGHFCPTPVVIAERFEFYRQDQRQEESVVQYMAELRKLADHCRFGGQLGRHYETD